MPPAAAQVGGKLPFSSYRKWPCRAIIPDYCPEGVGMRRRNFMTVLAGAAAAVPLSLRAQQKAMPVIGYLSSVPAGPASPYVASVRQGLSDTGYIEGQNLTIEYRWAEGRYDRLPALAADLVGRKVDVISTSDLIAALAAKSATSTIPIVFETGGDPV